MGLIYFYTKLFYFHAGGVHGLIVEAELRGYLWIKGTFDSNHAVGIP